MNKWKGLAILFTLLSIGALQETYRILTSNAPDIAQNRRELIPVGVIISGIFVSGAARCWYKASNNRGLLK